MEVSSEAWAGQSGRCTDVRDRDYGAERDGYAGAGVHFEPTIRHGFSAGFDGVGAVVRAPVGTVGQLVSNRRYRYASRSDQAGTFGRYERATWDDWSTGARTATAAEYDRYAEAAGNAVSIDEGGVAGPAGWTSSPAGAASRQHVFGEHYELAICNG